MNRLDSLYKVTEQILTVLTKQYSTVDERTEIISQVNELLEERGTILQQLKPPYTEEEEATGLEVVSMDKVIQEKMDHIFQLIQDDLKQLKQQKNRNKTYINPYKDMKIVDGMYLDNKL